MLEKLIAKLCPDGVEYKPLGKVAKVCRGVLVVKAQLSKVGKYPVYQNSITPLGYHLERNCKAGTTFVIAAGAAGEIGYCNVDFWAADDCYYIETDKNLNGRFVYYCLMTMRLQLTSKVRKASVPRLARSFVDNLVIPIPPLPVQKEIVRMLDDMSGLIDALEEELAARKKQYEWYKDNLLRMKNGVEYKKLGDVCEISAGGDVPESCVKGQLEPSKERPYPVYSNGIGENSLYGFASEFRVAKDSVTVSARGTIGYHCCRAANYTGIVRLISLIPKEDLLVRYLNYALTQIEFNSGNGGIPQLTVPMIKERKIAVPPLSEQQRIVKILDSFDTLCNSMTEGLSGEIALRKQQYEYYRDKLLTFKRKLEVA